MYDNIYINNKVLGTYYLSSIVKLISGDPLWYFNLLISALLAIR